MTLDLTDDERAALLAHLRHAIEYYPFVPLATIVTWPLISHIW